MATMPGMTTTAAAATTSAATTPAATGADHPALDATLPPVGPGTVHHYTIRLEDETLDIAPGVEYAGWTFDGSAPGPVIHVRQGDMVDITLVNGGAIPHSIDFHAALIAPNVPSRTIPTGGESCTSASAPRRRARSCTTAARRRCSRTSRTACTARSSSIPKGGLPPVAKSVRARLERVVPRTATARQAPATLDFEKARQMQPDFVTFNGYAAQYKDHPLTANPGDTVRFYVVDAGPSLDTDFHVVGAILDRVYLDGTTTDVLHGVQTQLVPAGRRHGLRRQLPRAAASTRSSPTPSRPSTWARSASSTSATSPAR